MVSWAPCSDAAKEMGSSLDFLNGETETHESTVFVVTKLGKGWLGFKPDLMTLDLKDIPFTMLPTR